MTPPGEAKGQEEQGLEDEGDVDQPCAHLSSLSAPSPLTSSKLPHNCLPLPLTRNQPRALPPALRGGETLSCLSAAGTTSGAGLCGVIRCDEAMQQPLTPTQRVPKMVVVVWGRGKERKRGRAGGGTRERRTKGGRGRDTAGATCHGAEMHDDKSRGLRAASNVSAPHFMPAAGRSSRSSSTLCQYHPSHKRLIAA